MNPVLIPANLNESSRSRARDDDASSIVSESTLLTNSSQIDNVTELTPGFCYLALFEFEQWQTAIDALGRYPSINDVMRYIICKELIICDVQISYFPRRHLVHLWHPTIEERTFNHRRQTLAWECFKHRIPRSARVGAKIKHKSLQGPDFIPGSSRIGSLVSRVLMREIAKDADRFDFVEMPWGKIPSPTFREKYRWWYDVDSPFSSLELPLLVTIRYHVKTVRDKLPEGEEFDAFCRYLDRLRFVIKEKEGGLQARPESVLVGATAAGMFTAASGLLHHVYTAEEQEVMDAFAQGVPNAFMKAPSVKGVNWQGVFQDLFAIFLICKSSRTLEDLTQRCLGIALLRRADLKNFFESNVSRLTEADVGTDIDDPLPPLVARQEASKATSYMNNLREMKDNFSESRLGMFLKSAIAGIICSSLIEDDDVLKSNLKKLDKMIPGESMQGADFLELTFNVVEYVVEFVEVAATSPDDVMGFLFPSSVSRRMAWVRARVENFMSGTLERVNETPEKFADEVYKLGIDLSATVQIMQKRDRYSLRSTTHYLVWINELNNIKERMASSKYTHNPRPRPICFSFVGKSSIGKSSLVEQTIALFARSQGITASEERIWRASDGKYHDGHLEGKDIYIWDDVANAKISEQDIQQLLLAKLVRIVNNAPYLSIQAEADKKGCQAHKPKLVIITSNVYDLKCLQYCNDLPSFWNRVKSYEVKVKPQYAKPDGTINSDLCTVATPVHYLTPLYPDLTPLGVSKDKKPSTVSMRFKMDKEGKKTETKGIEEWMPIWVDEWEKHFKQQEKLVQDMMELKNEEMCVHKCLRCFCATCSLIPQMEKDALAKNARPESFQTCSNVMAQALYNDIIDWFAKMKVPRLQSTIGNWVGNMIIEIGKSYFEVFMESPPSKQAAILLATGSLVTLLMIPFAALLVYDVYLGLACIYGLGVLGYALSCHVKSIATECIVTRVRSGLFDDEPLFVIGAKALTCLAVAREVLGFVRTFAKARPEALFVENPMEVIQEKKTSLWEHFTSFIPSEPKGTTTLDERYKQYTRRTFQVYNERRTLCYAFACSREVLLVPHHAWLALVDHRRITIGRPGKMDSIRVCQVLKVVNPPNTDWCFICLDGQIEVRITDQLLSSDLGHNSGLYPNKEGGWTPLSLKYEENSDNGTKVNGQLVYQRGYYAMDFNTQPGMCMLPVFSSAPPYKIIAFHMGGSLDYAEQKFGVAYALTPDMLSSYLDNTSIAVPHSCVHDSFVMRGGKMKKVSPPEQLHPRSCFQEAFTSNAESREKLLTLTGSLDEGVSPKSQVTPAFLSRFLPSEEDKWGPPRFLRHRDYQNNFTKIQNRMTIMDPKVMEWAVNDYVYPLTLVVPQELKKKGAKISFFEAVNGVMDNRFVSKVDINTSGGPGFPKKKEIFWREEPTTPLEWDPLVEEETMRLISDMESGVMVYPRVSTALKDEIVVKEEILGKRKVRVFYIFPTHFLMAGKMLFARLNTFLHAVAATSGLMGGMNHTTEDWGDLMDLLAQRKYKMDTDYSGFDTSQGPQTFLGVKEVLIGLLPTLGYTPKEVRACLAYVDCMRDADVEYNLALVSFYGVLKSGVWITLLVNGIVNSLLWRCAYRIMHQNVADKDMVPFLEQCFLAVQGDDADFATDNPLITPERVQKTFASFNMKITPGGKDGGLSYQKIDKIVFCKRTFRPITWKGRRFVESPLDIDSLWKPLYWKLSDINELDHCLGNLTPFMLEISRHPKPVFERETAKLRKALLASGLGDVIKEIPHWDYDYWINRRLKNIFKDVEDDPGDAHSSESRSLGG